MSFWRSPYEVSELIGRQERIFVVVADGASRLLEVRVSPAEEPPLTYVGRVRFSAAGLWLAQVRPLPTSRDAGSWGTDPQAFQILHAEAPRNETPSSREDRRTTQAEKLASALVGWSRETWEFLVASFLGVRRFATTAVG